MIKDKKKIIDEVNNEQWKPTICRFIT
jgi:hypothetical protein